jgi:hypothetical protein
MSLASSLWPYPGETLEAEIETLGNPGEPLGNVIEFPETLTETPRETEGKPTYSSEDLAKLVGVSVQALRRNWLPWIDRAQPHGARVGRRYTQRAYDLLLSLRCAKEDGRTAEQWLPQQLPPSPSAIVPVEVVQLGEARSSALTLARANRATALDLLDAVVLQLAEQDAVNDAISADIDVERIAADEALRIYKEQQVRAQVRAQFAQRKAALEGDRHAQQLQQFQGGRDGG